MQNLYAQRVKDFQRLLKAAELDGYVCLSALEMRYFTGVDLAAEEAVLLLGTRKAYCLTKQMMLAKLTGIEKVFTLVSISGDLLAGSLDLAVQKKMLRLAFNPSGADFVRGEYLSRAGLARMDGVVEEMRRVKYADEAALIQKACRIAAAAFREVQPQIKTGMSEEEVRILMAAALPRCRLFGQIDNVPNFAVFGRLFTAVPPAAGHVRAIPFVKTSKIH